MAMPQRYDRGDPAMGVRAEGQASGARPAPGGEVAVFGIVKMACQISPQSTERPTSSIFPSGD